MNDIATAVAKVNALASHEDAARALALVQDAKRQIREWDAALKAGMLQLVKASGGSLLIGRTLYTVGFANETKCEDVSAALPDLLDASGGDLGLFAGCLAAGALKPGACRQLLPAEAFARHFKTSRKDKLNTKEQELLEIDLDYTKRS